MQSANRITRRGFLQGSAGVSTASLLKLGSASLIALTQAACSAKEQQAALTVLSRSEAADLAAIAARIIPTTDTPGANEAGVIYFIDAAFADAMSDSLGFARTGLAEFNSALDDAHPDAARFGQLPDEQQDAFLAAREDTPFFDLCWVMTLFGMFAMSKYGGNKDNIGWQLVGFDGAHGGWQYPFGYYDAEVHGGQADAGAVAGHTGAGAHGGHSDGG